MSASHDHPRAELATTCRRLYDREMVGSTGGNVSVRLDDGLLVSPTGRSLAALQPGDFVEVTATGEAVDGTPSKELPLHTSIYSGRADVGAVIHGHCAAAIAAASLLAPHETDALPAYTSGYIARVGRLPLIAYLPSGSQQLADAVARALGDDGRAVLLQNHGFVAAGPSLQQAHDTAEEMVDALKIFLLTNGRAAGLPDDARAATPGRSLEAS